MEYVVDRIENDMVLLEMPDGDCVDVPRKLLPDAKEGDIVNITVDSQKTEKRKEELEKRANRLWKDQ